MFFRLNSSLLYNQLWLHWRYFRFQSRLKQPFPLSSVSSVWHQVARANRTDAIFFTGTPVSLYTSSEMLTQPCLLEWRRSSVLFGPFVHRMLFYQIERYSHITKRKERLDSSKFRGLERFCISLIKSNSVNAISCWNSDKLCIFAMRFSTSFPPNLTFYRGSGDFLLSSTKIQNIYHTDNNSLDYLVWFYYCPYINMTGIITMKLAIAAFGRYREWW